MGKFSKRAAYHIPILGWTSKYKLADFLHDFLAGLSVAGLLVPQAMGYSRSLVDVSETYGLFAAFFPLLVYSVFGTSRQLAVGPSAIPALLTGSALVGWSEPDRVKGMACISLAVGLIYLTLGLLHFGFVDCLLSFELLNGLINGLALVVIIGQIPALLGLTIPNSKKMKTIELAWEIMKKIMQTNWKTLGLSVCCISFLFTFKALKLKFPNSRVFQLMPTTFITVSAMSLLSWKFYFEDNGIAVIGKITDGELKFEVPPLIEFDSSMIFNTAIVIAIIGFVESVAGVKKYATKYAYSVSADKELIALGLVNTISSFFGCFPTSCSLSRTAVNDMSGCRSQMSGIVASIVVALTGFNLMTYLNVMPKLAIASIIFYGVSGLFDISEMLFLIKIRAYRSIILLSTAFLVTFLGSVELGTMFVVVSSIVIVLQRCTKPRIAIMGKIGDKFKSIDEFPSAQQYSSVLVIKLNEPLFFHNTGQLKDRLRQIEMHRDQCTHPSEESLHDPLQFCVFDMGLVPSADSASLKILIEIISDFKTRNIRCCFVKIQSQLMERFIASGILVLVGDDMIFRTVNDAIDMFESMMSSK